MRFILALSLVVFFSFPARADQSQRGGESFECVHKSGGEGVFEIPYSDFLDKVNQGNVTSIRIKHDYVTGLERCGAKFAVIIPPNTDMVSKIEGKGVKITAVLDTVEAPTFLSVLLSWFPMLLLLGIFVIMTRKLGTSRLLQARSLQVSEETLATFKEGVGALSEILEILKRK